MNVFELFTYSLLSLSIALTVLIIVLFVKLLGSKGQTWTRGAVPTSEEIFSDKVKDLAHRLKGESDKETLTNIVEWQHRNMKFWLERYPMPLIMGASLIGLIISFVVPQILIVLGLNVWWIGSFFVLGFGVFLMACVAITLMYICYGRRLSLSQFWNIFRPSVRIDDIIENRLGVCRDYAKLTACLLSNLYSESDIYFAHTSNHVAVGLVSNGQLYMLDQKLPILTIEQWDKREESKEKIHKLKNGEFEQVNDLSKYRKNQQSFEEFIKKLKDLGITISSSTNAKPINIIKWRKGVLLYSMNDEVVNHSLAHRIKYEVANDLLEFEKIRIEIQENGEDLEFLIKNLIE
jgi:predicted transglutaminase-like protease